MNAKEDTVEDRRAARVLQVLGGIDLLRGTLHTALAPWAARTFAGLHLATAKQDQLTLLGAFGVSNLLTGGLYLLVANKAKPLARPALLLIPASYLLGVAGIRASGTKPQSRFLGRYFMMGYLAACVATFALTRPKAVPQPTASE